MTIPIDGDGGTVQFKSDKKGSVDKVIESFARKAIDSCTSTYKLKIIDYTSETLEKLSAKYMAVEVYNIRLEESNIVLLKSLSIAQEDNLNYQKEIADLKMRLANLKNKDVEVGLGKMRSLRKVKDEKRELCETEERKPSMVSKKLKF